MIRKLKFLWAISTVFLFFELYSTQIYAHHIDPECKNMGIGECRYKISEASNEEMNKLYEEKMASLHSEEYKKLLSDAQRAWVAFRDSSCSYEIGGTEGMRGVWAEMYADCETRLTNQRIKDLKIYLACTIDKNRMCPD